MKVTSVRSGLALRLQALRPLALCSVLVAGVLQSTAAYSQIALDRSVINRPVAVTEGTSGVTIDNSTGYAPSNGISAPAMEQTSTSTTSTSTAVESGQTLSVQLNSSGAGRYLAGQQGGINNTFGGSTPAVGSTSTSTSGQPVRSAAALQKQAARDAMVNSTESTRYNSQRGLRNMMWNSN